MPAPEVSDAAANVLRAAYYYGLVGGHTVIDPALVLVAAARNDKAVALPVLGAAVAGALPLLTAGAPGPAPATTGEPALREARWWVLRDAEETERTPGWDAEVARALERAAPEAPRIGVAALLLGLLTSAHPAVRTLAETAGLDIAAAVSALRDQRPWPPEEPFTPLTGLLGVTGLTDQRYPLLIRWAPGLLRRFTTRRERWGPVPLVLELEILRQTVLTGHPAVRAAHLPLAIVSMQEQLAAIGSDLAARYRPRNQGGRLLTERGFDLRAAQQAVEGLPHGDDVLTPSETERRPLSTGKFSDPSWTRAAAAAMHEAAAVARRHQHPDTGTTHLLAAALSGADPTAALLLETLGIDAPSLRDDVDRQLD